MLDRRQLEREGFEVTYLPQSNGIIDLKELEAAMRDDTIPFPSCT